MLSGRNFETKQFDEKTKLASFKELEDGVMDAINETHFQRFIMILKSAGIISRGFYSSVNNVNISYALYLRLKAQKMPPNKIEKIVRRWFVMSNLTGRYSTSVGSQIEADLKNFKKGIIENYLKSIEKAELSNAFWSEGLISSLKQAKKSGAYLGMFWAAQVNNNEKAFLSKDHGVQQILEQKGDLHHIFPKKYLQNNGLSRNSYNQSANFAWTQQEINIKLGKTPPNEYMKKIEKQCKGSRSVYGSGINILSELKQNLKENCIPESIFNGTVKNYEIFLEERRKLMAEKIRDYYENL